MKRLICSAALALLCALPLQAAVYTYVDADGNRVFTDQPDIEGASKVDIQPANVTSMPVPVVKKSPPKAERPAPKEPRHSYSLLRIVMPLPDAGIQSGNGGLLVVLESDPPLLAGDLYRVELDGKVQGVPSRSPVFTLDNIDRGTHQLAGEIVDAQGQVLERTPAQPVNILRPSLEQRRRVAGCTDETYGKAKGCPESLRP